MQNNSVIAYQSCSPDTASHAVSCSEHAVSYSDTASHAVSCSDTASHAVSYSDTASHAVSCSDTASHAVSCSPDTACHAVSCFGGTRTVNVSVMHVLSKRWCCVMQSGCIQLLSFQFSGQSCYFRFSGQSCCFSFLGDTLNNYMLFSGHVEWLYFTVSGWSLSHWSCF